MYRKSVRLTPTRILEVWEKDANFPLPGKICHPKSSCRLQLDRKGIHVAKKLIPWSDITFTAVAVHHIAGGRHEHYIRNYFMAYTSRGDIINEELGDLEEYSNLTGHFIELYKAGSSGK